GDERVAILDGARPAGLLEVGTHALLAARNLEQLAVELDIPFDVEPHFGKRAVERDAVAILFRVDEDAVTIKNQCLHRCLLKPPSTALRRRGWCRRTVRSFP